MIALAITLACFRSFASLAFSSSSGSRSSCKLKDICGLYPLVAKNRLMLVVLDRLAFIAALASNS